MRVPSEQAYTLGCQVMVAIDGARPANAQVAVTCRATSNLQLENGRVRNNYRASQFRITICCVCIYYEKKIQEMKFYGKKSFGCVTQIATGKRCRWSPMLNACTTTILNLRINWLPPTNRQVAQCVSGLYTQNDFPLCQKTIHFHVCVVYDKVVQSKQNRSQFRRLEIRFC